MRLLFGLLIISTVLYSCNGGDKIPDVSGEKVTVTTQHFEKDFFAIDTNNIDAGLTQLRNKYPSFFPDFLEKLLGVDAKMIETGEANNIIRSFYHSYLPVYDSTKMLFADFSATEKEITQGLRFVKHYFPNYKLPGEIITFIAPMDASFKTSFGLQGDILSNNYIGAGLQLHMGSGFSFYQSEQGQQLYPTYISSRFEPGTIAINSIKNIVDDLFPEKLEDRSLAEQMVEKGKRLYVLSKLMPYAEEYRLIGYTAKQVKDCYEHEANIWDLFVQNNLLQTVDENIIKNYIGESPKTQELGDASPGNIGAFAGWQIVKKFMSKNNETTLQQLMAMEDDALFQQAKYKP
ncbi:gliding motility lipoprotein GldB [Ferruginibacter sp.]